MSYSGAPCEKCNMPNAMQRRQDTKSGDYWACWSCGFVVEDPELRQDLPSDGAEFAPGYRR